jgi:hypothetical protein
VGTEGQTIVNTITGNLLKCTQECDKEVKCTSLNFLGADPNSTDAKCTLRSGNCMKGLNTGVTNSHMYLQRKVSGKFEDKMLSFISSYIENYCIILVEHKSQNFVVEISIGNFILSTET